MGWSGADGKPRSGAQTRACGPKMRAHTCAHEGFDCTHCTVRMHVCHARHAHAQVLTKMCKQFGRSGSGSDERSSTGFSSSPPRRRRRRSHHIAAAAAAAAAATTTTAAAAAAAATTTTATTHACMHACTHAHTHARARTLLHTSTRIHVHVQAHVYPCKHARACMHAYGHTCTLAHACICAFVRAHVHTRAPRPRPLKSAPLTATAQTHARTHLCTDIQRTATFDSEMTDNASEFDDDAALAMEERRRCAEAFR